MLYSIERLDWNRYWVKSLAGYPVGFAVSDGGIWVGFLLWGDWLVCDSLHEALQYVVANACV